ncbi:MAG: carbohydrate-binding domain-containing protein [Paludibacteraceae bacterium]|nr:carbohydrate-binding domain-containing protein [Paludibacteraceae bacterium]
MKRLTIFISFIFILTTLCSATTQSLDTNVVIITYNGNSATVEIADNIKSYVTATINGGHVTVAQSSLVDETTCGEIEYQLYGSTTNGSFTLQGSYKATVSLYGVSIYNPSGAAIDIQNGKRIDVSSKNETISTLRDGTNGDWKGAFQCKGHTEFKGRGCLNVYGNTKHGIWSNEYVEIKNCTINILSAVKDGLNVNQYFLMESGVLNISGFGDDGIQVTIKDAASGDAEDTGNFLQTGGSITINTFGAEGNALKYEGVKNCTGGTLTIMESATSVEQNMHAELSPAVIYSVLGTFIGRFEGESKAIAFIENSSLPAGIYIISSNYTQRRIIK